MYIAAELELLSGGEQCRVRHGQGGRVAELLGHRGREKEQNGQPRRQHVSALVPGARHPRDAAMTRLCGFQNRGYAAGL